MSAPASLYRKGMVMTVGTGTRPETDIVAPLLKSIQNANPDVVVLLVTDESARHAADLRGRFGSPAPRCEERRLRSADLIDEIFHDCLRAIRWLLDQGLAPEQITADYTSGTKSMSAGLALAAVALGCGDLRYISGRRVNGVVAAGTERFLSIQASALLAFYDLRRAEELLRRLQFHAALELSTSLSDALLAETDRAYRQALMLAAQAYDAWDKFQHHQAKKLFGQLQDGSSLPSDLLVDPQLPHRLGQIGDAVYQQRFTEDLVADLVANAARRLYEGRWDDAAARLYRATEMLAQFALQRDHCIETKKVEPRCLPAHLREQYGGQELGLADAYELLTKLDHPLGQAYATGPESPKQHLATRNQSILAHGTQPVSEHAARGFYERVCALARIQIEDFDERLRMLQFPWLRSAVS
ncbi:MAG: TIGR02710 family CRISPR-associated protein [Chloroflexota bacterium]